MNNEVSNAELVTALIKARSEFPDIPKTKTAKAGAFSYKYADLGDILPAIIPVLSKHGMVLSQRLGFRVEDGRQMLETYLLHVEGQSISSQCYLPDPATTPAQQFGSYLTYVKRYSICALLGIHPEDDLDGQDIQPKPTQAYKTEPYKTEPKKQSAQLPTPRAAYQAPSKQAESDDDFGFL